MSQDLQSIIAGFVLEACKQQSYHALLVEEGTEISSIIFADASLQANAIRQNLQVNILQMTAGPYKKSNLSFNVFYPDPPEQRRRDPHEPTAPAGTPPPGDHTGTSTPSSQAKQSSFMKGPFNQAGSPIPALFFPIRLGRTVSKLCFVEAPILDAHAHCRHVRSTICTISPTNCLQFLENIKTS